MKSDSQGYGYDLMRVIGRERDTQKGVCRLPIATTGREASQTADAVPQCDGRNHDIRHLPSWEPVFPKVPGRDGKRAQQSAVEDSAGTQEAPGVVLHMFPVHDDQEELGTNECRNQNVEPEIHRHAGFDADLLRSPGRDLECYQESDSEQEPVRVKDGMECATPNRDLTEVEDFRKHSRGAQDSRALGCEMASLGSLCIRVSKRRRPTPVQIVGIGEVESGPMRATIEDVDEIDDVAEAAAVDDVA